MGLPSLRKLIKGKRGFSIDGAAGGGRGRSREPVLRMCEETEPLSVSPEF